jgi:hypothetical protein
LEAAIVLAPEACGADAYALLGGLYAQLPGFPISFGNEDAGRRHLLKALAMNPTGALPNLAYACFLLKVGQFDSALSYANAALRAPPRLGREKADANLRAQAEDLIAKSNAGRGSSGQLKTQVSLLAFSCGSPGNDRSRNEHGS